MNPHTRHHRTEQKQSEQLNQKLSEQSLFERVNSALDHELNDVDALTQAKVAAARQNALSSLQSKSSLFDWRAYFDKPKALALSGAFSAVFSVVLITSMIPEAEQTVEHSVLEAMFIPELEEDPEMLEQLEFIAWLEQDALLEQVEKGV